MGPEQKLPPRTLPVVYFAFAHVALLTAFLLVATHPTAIAGFFYHPRMFAVIHLITLGWITGTILGATYVAGPLALRMPAPANWVDGVACGAYMVGVGGVIAHFWLGTYWGVATSGMLLFPACGVVAVRTWRALARGAAPRPVKWHIGLAYFNLLLAALYGICLAINRERSFLPGSQLSNVFAHVHLAGVGWATLMVAGVGYRLLAMLFPAAPPPDRPIWVSAVLFEIGVLGLAGSLPFHRGWAKGFAVVTAAAVALLLGLVLWMRRHPRPAPPKLKRPDFGVLHALQAMVYLVATAAVGLYLVHSPQWQLPWIMVYGVCGLVGFLAQIVVGVGMRLFPMFAWLEGWAGSGFKVLPPSPHEAPRRWLQATSLALWTAGIPLLAYGLARDQEPVLVAGAGALAAGTVVVAVNNALVLRCAFPRRVR
ncbi:MAG: hypothetical protein ACYTEZ_01415 [Planctomycetota bacterium]